MFVSQYRQDEFVEYNIFKGFRNGFFVDVGAHDGISINNTLYFEKQNEWRGINIEPIPEVYANLVKNRPNCINLNVAIDKEKGATDFYLNKGYTEMLSGIVKYYEKKHKERMENELSEHGGSSDIVNVPTRRLDDIFAEYNVDHVHLLSIDVEGGEMAVLESIDFQKVFIDVIIIEDNYRTGITRRYLEKEGFVPLIQIPDQIMINKKSVFYTR